MIGKRLKEIRLKKQLSVQQLSQIVEIPERTLGGYERNERKPPYELLELLHGKFGVNLNYLITGIGEPFLKDFDEKLKDRIQQEVTAILKSKGIE